jgi:hypothetical protein
MEEIEVEVYRQGAEEEKARMIDRKKKEEITQNRLMNT